MNLDWKWPEGFTPLTGSRSMVNLHQPEETATPEPLPRSESSMALVEMREGTSPHPDNDKVKLDERVISMSSTYYQCRGGRDANFRDKAVELANTMELGHVVGGEVSRVGSFEQENGLLEMCFVGSRVLRGSEVCNQNISLTFDPSTMTCICCPREHSIFMSGKALCICVSDQNFVSNIAAGKNCISVVRLESGSLGELTDLVIELFENQKFPPGSVICLGSASHLHKVGLTVYTMDWNRCLDTLTKRIGGIQICPLIPVITDNIPGSLANDLIALVSWLTKQYEGSTLGLVSTWALLAGTITTLTVEEMQSPNYFSVAMPTSLAVGSPLTTHRFRCTSSRRVTSAGCDAKATDELLSALLSALSKDLGIDCHPGDILVRKPIKEQGPSDRISSIILVGASHMRRVEPHLQSAGYKVSLLSLMGGLPTNHSISHMQEKLTGISLEPGTAVVFDLFGNFTYRYEQEDGGMSLPVPIQGVHHMFGKVDVCTDEMFKSVISKLVPVLSQLSSVPCVVLPAIPRYLKGGCCGDQSHATNAGKPGEDTILVEKLLHLRKLLKTELASSSCTGYWVPDVVAHLSATAVSAPVSMQDKVSKLRELFSSDCVHLTGLGYTRLGECIAEALKLAVERRRDTAECVVSGVKRSYYWRGFNSIKGGSRSSFTASGYKSKPDIGSARGGRGFHPYRARGGQRGRGGGGSGGSRSYRN